MKDKLKQLLSYFFDFVLGAIAVTGTLVVFIFLLAIVVSFLEGAPR